MGLKIREKEKWATMGGKQIKPEYQKVMDWLLAEERAIGDVVLWDTFPDADTAVHRRRCLEASLRAQIEMPHGTRYKIFRAQTEKGYQVLVSIERVFAGGRVKKL